MSNYTFSTQTFENTLIPVRSPMSEEYLAEHERRFMTEHLLKDGYKYFRRYRFRTNKPADFFGTLENDVLCPYCQGRMILCGMPVSTTAHGLYRCRRCDKETERRG